MASQKEEEVTALTLHAERQGTALEQTKRQLNELKKGMNPLGMVGMGGVAAATAAGIGFMEGYRAGDDPALQKAQKGVAPAAALVVGGIGAMAAGANNPKLRAASAGVATGGAAVLAYVVSHDEGVQMKLEGAKLRAAGQAAAQAQQTPAPQVQGFKR